jgi:hypothetical protein
MTFLTKSRITLSLTLILSVFFISCGKENQYQVGDIVLSDGKVLSKEAFSVYGGNAKPMAVIFSTQGGHCEESNRILGVSLNYSEPIQFAPLDSTGYKTNMLANQAKMIGEDLDLSSGMYMNRGFAGLFDGRKTWSNISYYDAEAKKSMTGYPAYEYAVNYGKNKGFKKFEDGWYLPTAAEAFELAENRNVFNSSLSLCGAELLDETIWTSSQDYDSKNLEYTVNLLDANIDVGFKDDQYSVYSIYCFN